MTLYRGSAVFLAIYGFGSTISFGVHLLMARLLGAKSYGYFVYATSWMAILLLSCNIGLKPTVVRFVAAYNARGEWGSLRGLLKTREASAPKSRS
jgi:O-antigen/teichoic acid export membrane protein